MNQKHYSKRHSTTLKPTEHSWIRTIPEIFPDILRCLAVTFKEERDIPRIQANKYVLFTRPYRGKQGLLIIGKHARPVIIDEDSFEKPYILPMRLDRESILDTWIFGVSIYKDEKLIQLEDCIVSNGEQLRSTKPFSERYGHMERFVNSMWYKDISFQGFEIKMVETYSLDCIKKTMETIHGGCLCLMPNSPTFRLLKVTSVFYREPEKKEVEEHICVPAEGKPDVYTLFINGEDKGRACIQTLSISHALQQKRISSDKIHVIATWEPEFESYVITSVL
jgi:hypothetical protein